MPKPASKPPLTPATIFATKGAAGLAAPDATQRTPAEESLVDLNFKVPNSFRRRFKIRAAQEGITGVELLRRLFEQSS